MTTSSKIYGIGAEFDSACALRRAAESLRDAGFRNWDAFSPFPIHGMDAAMGLRPSLLGKIVFLGGLAGFLLAVALQFLPTSVWYPLLLGGKPHGFFTLPALFPIMVELTILVAAATAVIGMLAMNRLPRLNHPLFAWDRFKKVTDDKFFVVIEAHDPQFDADAIRARLTALGASHITLISEE